MKDVRSAGRHGPVGRDEWEPSVEPGRLTNIGSRGQAWDGAPYKTATLTGERIPWSDHANRQPAPMRVGEGSTVLPATAAPVAEHAGDSSGVQGTLEEVASIAGKEPLHRAHKLQVQFGSGTITGAISANLELGKTSFKPADIALWKSTASTKINDWSRKFELQLINGKLDTEMFEGLHVAFEGGGPKVTSKDSLELEGVTPWTS